MLLLADKTDSHPKYQVLLLGIYLISVLIMILRLILTDTDTDAHVCLARL